MNKNIVKDSLVTGFAAFAIFFGAGNLIFPGAIGLAAGDQWPVAIIAAILCGVVLPFMALVAVANAGDSWSDLCKPVGVWYDKGTFFVTVVGIGILSNIPRTGATTYEVAIAPIFPSCPSWVTIVIFFALTLFFAFDEKGLIDKIGKYLTPLMLVFLVIIVGKGMVTPLGVPGSTGQEQVFKNSFIEFYYTGDLFSGLLISSIFLADLKRKGYDTRADRKRMTIYAVIVAGIASIIVYGGLLIMGAQSTALYEQGTDRTTLLAGMVNRLLGNFGTAVLSASAALACLSTAAGLVGIAANFLADLVKNKINYKAWVVILCIFSSAVACLGVENIISIASPIFMLTYPSGLVVTFLGMFFHQMPNDGAFRGAVIGAVIAGVFDCLSSLGVTAAGAFMGKMPFADYGFDWVLFAVIGFFVGWVLGRKSADQKAAASRKPVA